MRISIAALTGMILAAGVPALADDLDLSTWTCKQFQAAGKDQVGVIMAWLDGYYKDEDDPPIIDLGQFAVNAKKLGDYCTAHPDDGLITATDKLFQKE
jgi:acid stress chaperone HdeB